MTTWQVLSNESKLLFWKINNEKLEIWQFGHNRIKNINMKIIHSTQRIAIKKFRKDINLKNTDPKSPKNISKSPTLTCKLFINVLIDDSYFIEATYNIYSNCLNLRLEVWNISMEIWYSYLPVRCSWTFQNMKIKFRYNWWVSKDKYKPNIWTAWFISNFLSIRLDIYCWVFFEIFRRNFIDSKEH